jgi:DNA-binding GntR family transcriptional regulator
MICANRLVETGQMETKKGGRTPNQGHVLDRNASLPVYKQLAESLHQRILAGEFQPGEQLPAEIKLAAMYKVSPMTVRQALNRLSSQNIVTAIRGSGTYVKEIELGSASFYLQNLGELFGDEENTVIRILEARLSPATAKIADKLSIPVGERVIFIRRLLVVSGEPAFYHRAYLINDPDRPVVEAELEVTDLKGLFQGSGGSIIKFGDLYLESIILNEEETTLLNLEPPAPGMTLEHIYYDFENKPVSWGWFVCTSSRLKMHTRVGIVELEE